MNKFFYGFIAFLFLFLSIYPFSNVFADNDFVITGTPVPVQSDITDDQLTDIIVSGITADLVSQGYEIDFSASDGDWDNFKNAILDVIFDQASDGTGFIGEIYNSALYHNLIGDDLTIWYPDNSDDTILPGLSKRSIYRNLSDGLVNNILEHRSDNSPTPTPNPDTNYLIYIDRINGSGFFWKNYSESFDLGGGYYQLANYYPYYNYSYCSIPRDSNNMINSIYNSIVVDNINAQCVVGNIYDVNIYSSNDVYYVNISFNKFDYVAHNEWNNLNFNTIYFYSEYDRFSGIDVSSISNLAITGSYSGTLEQVLAWVSNRFRNVNIYVDGVPWSIVGSSSLPTINIYPGYVLQGTNYPMQYYFPEPPKFDYQQMIDIIKHALLQYGVIQWEDIADVFVDVNGQTAVAILEMHRNDYDILYDEQYPGIALPNRFNTHLLDSSHQYLLPVVQTVDETTGVLPGEIKGALAIGMMLTIFACLIHRLLE